MITINQHWFDPDERKPYDGAKILGLFMVNDKPHVMNGVYNEPIPGYKAKWRFVDHEVNIEDLESASPLLWSMVDTDMLYSRLQERTAEINAIANLDQELFDRIFKDFYGILPGECRTNGQKAIAHEARVIVGLFTMRDGEIDFATMREIMKMGNFDLHTTNELRLFYNKYLAELDHAEVCSES